MLFTSLTPYDHHYDGRPLTQRDPSVNRGEVK